MLNIVKSGDYVKFIELKHHKIFRVVDINKKTGNVYVQCQHCNMRIHGIAYYLMEIIPKPKKINKSKLWINPRPGLSNFSLNKKKCCII